MWDGLLESPAFPTPFDMSERKMFEDLEANESSTYSQNGEDGVLKRIFEQIGTTNKYFVEFGTGPYGLERNTRRLEVEDGWQGLLMDLCAHENSSVRREQITAENINELFAKYEVPHEFDLLSIDIDGNDYWILKALAEHYQPRAMVLEYNASFPPPAKKSIEYEPDFMWQKTDYYGASLAALEALSRRRGYCLVYCDLRGINAFLVRQDVIPEFKGKPVEQMFRGPNFAKGKLWGLAKFYWPQGVGHRKDRQRQMIDVD